MAYLHPSFLDLFQLHTHQWPVHKYIVASRSDYLRNLVTASCNSEVPVPVLNVTEDLSVEIMEQILLYIYTDTCHYLKVISLVYAVHCTCVSVYQGYLISCLPAILSVSIYCL